MPFSAFTLYVLIINSTTYKEAFKQIIQCSVVKGFVEKYSIAALFFEMLVCAFCVTVQNSNALSSIVYIFAHRSQVPNKTKGNICPCAKCSPVCNLHRLHQNWHRHMANGFLWSFTHNMPSTEYE